MNGPSLFDVAIQIQRGKNHKVMHELGSPGPTSNVLPTNPLLLPSPGIIKCFNSATEEAHDHVCIRYNNLLTSLSHRLRFEYGP